MPHSPGHQQHPGHKVSERFLDERVQVTVDAQTVADATRVLRVDEDGHPERYYFARDDVDMTRLEPSTTTTYCPFKGTATYFNLALRDRKIPDAAWTYDDPYAEHAALKGRVAFYDDNVPQMRIIHPAQQQ